MNLRNNKGYVMTDASIAVIILLILVPTIMGIVYSIGATRRATEAKSEAINIVTNTIEATKGIDLANLDNKKILDSLKADVYTDMTINQDTLGGETLYNGIIKTEKGTYQVWTSIVDYGKTHEGVENIVKTVTAKVKYRLRGTDQEISLSTVIK